MKRASHKAATAEKMTKICDPNKNHDEMVLMVSVAIFSDRSSTLEIMTPKMLTPKTTNVEIARTNLAVTGYFEYLANVTTHEIGSKGLVGESIKLRMA